MKRVAMFVTNPCVHDARVMKEAQTLSENGYLVRIFALASADYPEGVIEQDGYVVERFQFDSIFKLTQRLFWKFISFLTLPVEFFKRTIILSLRLFSAGIKTLVMMTGFVLFVLYDFTLRLLSLFFKSTPYKKDMPYRVFDIYRIIKPSMTESHRENQSNLRRGLARRSRVGFYLFMRRAIPFRLRHKVQEPALNIVSTILNLNLALVGVELRLKLYRFLPHSLTRFYHYIIQKFSRAVYVIFIPTHKVTTYLLFCREASKRATIWKPDIVHAHDLNTMYAGKLVKEKIRSKLVYDSHELWIHRNRVNREAKFERILDTYVEKWLIQYADEIITVCDSIGIWLLDRYKTISKPTILRNMPYRMETTQHSSSLDLKHRLGLSQDSIVMIYTGKITSGRGIEVGINTLMDVEGLNLVLLGYGEPKYVSKLERMIAQIGLGGRVFFCDPVPYQRVTEFIRGADFALVYIEPVCLSYEFALPNKLFESIQAGIPIMGSGLTEIKSVVEGLDIGLCFSSQKELANKLNTLQSSQLNKWRENIQKKKSLLCWEIEQQKLLELYAKLAA